MRMELVWLMLPGVLVALIVFASVKRPDEPGD
jgi:hypothetical protein